MGYTPAEGVPALDYDFNPYEDIKGITPEPSDKQIGSYWKSFSRLIRDNRRKVDAWIKRLDEAEAAQDDPDAQATTEAEYDAWQDTNADETRAARRALIAAVCSNQPSEEDLARLPGRVFDDFESYMQEELTPKGRRNASS